MYYLLNCLSRVKQILFCLFLSISIFMGTTYIHHDFSLRNILATPIIILLCIGCGEWGILGVSKTGRSIKVFEEGTKVYDFVTLFIILVGSIALLIFLVIYIYLYYNEAVTSANAVISSVVAGAVLRLESHEGDTGEDRNH